MGRIGRMGHIKVGKMEERPRRKGLREGLECGKMYEGNAYADPKLPHLATTLAQAADQFSRSAVARKYFGPEIVDFYTRTARNEIREFNAAVTDWERGRYFEKI